MPKKTKKMATSNPLSKEKSLSFSSVHGRINFLNEKHKKLLAQIKRKKTELSNLTQKIQTLSQEMFDKSRPLEEKLNSLDYEIHALFDKILSNKRLGKRQKQEVIDIYQTLQLAGKISLRPDYFSKSSSANFQYDIRDKLEDSTDQDFLGEDYDDDKNYSKFNKQPDISQPRPSRDLRKIFLKLADKFHPDKATDDETSILYTEIMKEINVAYKSGDLARLLEIERETNQKIVRFYQNDGEKECERLGKEIELLSQQYEQIKAELREVKNTPQGNMVKQYRKAERNGEDLMETLLKQAESEVKYLKRLRNFIKDFKNQKITLKEFIQGPKITNIDSMEDIMNEVFEKLFVVIGW